MHVFTSLCNIDRKKIFLKFIDKIQLSNGNDQF